MGRLHLTRITMRETKNIVKIIKKKVGNKEFLTSEIAGMFPEMNKKRIGQILKKAQISGLVSGCRSSTTKEPQKIWRIM